MGSIVSYDVSARQTEVKNDMIARGYADSFTWEGKTYYLPYTTLWKKDATVQTALADIKAAAAAQRVTLERAIALPEDPWAGIPGIPQK
jgi:hypothetical protein